MPPSGFSSKAVDGAAQFVRSCFEDLLAETRAGKHADFRSAIEFEMMQLVPHCQTMKQDGLTIAASLRFTYACYAELHAQLKSQAGFDPEAAIEATVTKISEQLVRVHINRDGELVEREPALQT